MVSTSRRRWLRALGTGLVGGFGGCLRGRGPDSTADAGGPSVDAGHRTSSPIPAGRTPETPNESVRTPTAPVRCRGEPATVERSLTDEPGYDDGVEYFPSNGTVRIVTQRRGGESARFDTLSFEEWGTIEAADVGRRRVHLVAGERLGTSNFRSIVGSPPDSSSAVAPVVRLRLLTRFDRDGDVVRTPVVALPDLAARAPLAADVTLVLDGDEFTREVPVFAETTSIRPE